MAAAVEPQAPPTIADVLERARAGRLWGRKCRNCRRVTFIDELRCGSCKKQEFAAFESKGEGEIVAFTVITFPAEAFASHGPYAFVVVRMAEGASTTGWMPSVRDPRQLRIGEKVRVALPPAGMGIAFEKA